MKHGLKPFSQSPRYESFVAGRDKALESILYDYLNAMDRCIDRLKLRCEQILAREYPHTAGAGDMHKVVMNFSGHSSGECNLTSGQVFELARRLRRTAYVLSRMGETEAMSRATARRFHVKISQDQVAMVKARPAPSGGTLENRMGLIFSRLHRDILDAVQMSLALEETLSEAKTRLRLAFPKLSRVKRGTKVLHRPKPMHEADKGTSFLSTGFVDPETWREILDDYLAENVPTNRGPSDKILFFGVTETGQVEFTERYEWELEQEITEDFVMRVREGQVHATKENGIEDVVWVNVTDDKTDECCLWRDGLTSAEIEQELESGEHADDDERAIVPPAHFNCRCRPVPASEELPDEAPPDFGSFDDWLDARAAA